MGAIVRCNCVDDAGLWIIRRANRGRCPNSFPQEVSMVTMVTAGANRGHGPNLLPSITILIQFAAISVRV